VVLVLAFALEEEGACLAGTSYTWRIADLSDSHGGSTQQLVCVQGFLHLRSKGQGCIVSVDRATREEGALSLGAFLFLELQSISRGVAIVSGSIVFTYLLYLML
jgi:hypothetical protein